MESQFSHLHKTMQHHIEFNREHLVKPGAGGVYCLQQFVAMAEHIALLHRQEQPESDPCPVSGGIFLGYLHCD